MPGCCDRKAGVPIPYSTVTVGSIVLLCDPPRDEAFIELVRRLLAENDLSTPEGLQAALRAVYPLAVVRARDAVASFGETLWYAYRDGRAALTGEGATSTSEA